MTLLKEISNDSRIYVHRTGFDPPPLKEEKRLTADLSEVKTFTNRYSNTAEENYPAIRQALMNIEKCLQKKSVFISSKDQAAFAKAGQELSLMAIEQPAVYLKTLSLLKSLADGEVASAELKKTLLNVRKTLWKVLPQQAASPVSHPATRNELDQKFLKSLEETKHD